jgi:hypothetical protein
MAAPVLRDVSTVLAMGSAETLLGAFLLRYQYDLSANAALKNSNVRCGRFGQSHFTADDRTQ